MNRIFKKSRNIKKLLTDQNLNDDEMSVLLSLDGIKTETELTDFLLMKKNQLETILDKLENFNLITLVKPKKSKLKPPQLPQKRNKIINKNELKSGAELIIPENINKNHPNYEEILTTKPSGNELTLNEWPPKTSLRAPEKTGSFQTNGSASLLHTKDLVKIYGKRTVVDEVCLQVKQGEIVGLLGPNGAGKTTTFYMITGLIRPNKGKIFLNDEEITKLAMFKRARRGIAYLPQEASIFRKLSVEENLLAIMEAINFPKKERKSRCEELMEELSISHVANNKGYNLSGGERRRTEIARTLVSSPKFILLDEPFAGVDPIAVEDIQNIVIRLKEKKIGVLITDHNVHETLSITDHAYLLYSGKILKEGNSEYLANDPEARRLYLGDKFQLYR